MATIRKGRWYYVHPFLTTDPNNNGKGFRGQRVYVVKVKDETAYVTRHKNTKAEAMYDVDALITFREYREIDF